MTAKEKAKFLVNEKFYQPLTLHLDLNNNSKQMWEYAKICANITVDEVLHLGVWELGDPEHIYWTEVKSELQNL
jgi:hypothetical protein